MIRRARSIGFPFDRPVAPSQTIRLDFSYSGAGEIATQFYIGPEVSFASAYGADWYPLLTDNEGVATARLDFTIPPGDTAIATGVRDGFADREGDGHFEFIVEQPTLFAFAAGRFMVTPGPQGSPIDLDGRPPVSVEFDPDYRILRRPAPGEPGG